MIRAARAPSPQATPSEAFWEQPLGYPHAFVTVITTLTVAMAFHVWIGYRWLNALAAWEIGAATLLPLLVLGVASRLHPGDRIVRWLTGIPFAMVTTITVGIFALAGGIVPSSFWASKIGHETIWSTWPFMMVGYLMLLNLVGSCGRRAWPLNYTNIIYLTSHLGLAVALVGGAGSSLLMERRTMVLFKGQPTSTAYDSQNREYRAPFSAQLREFKMESFAPTLTLAEIDEKSPDSLKQTPGSHLLKPGLKEKLKGHQIEVLKHFKHAAYDGMHWREVQWTTAAPATQVKVTTPKGETKTGWISSGSLETMPSYLMLDDKTAVLMNTPRPKKFESDIEIDGQKLHVGVNQPAKVKGWDVYQFSYDEKAGAASAYSVIELVRDPGLPVVFTGIFMMLFSAGLHLWNGIGGKK